MDNLKKIPIQKSRIIPYLLLALFTLIAYWPISLNIFTLKNDAIVYFLPYRYNISYAIQQGEFPFWSPYLYMGFPLHADMQSGVWNPVVLLISLFTTYNMTVLQAETLLYIFVAGAGMFKLIGEFVPDKKTRLIFAIAYMSCGFMTDSGQFIVWVASAAFLPFVFLYYYRLLQNNKHIDVLKCGISLFFLFTAGYPSYFIFCGYILLAALLCRIISIYRSNAQPAKVIGGLLGRNILLLALFVLLSAPALASYFEFLPHFSRGTAISLADAQINPFCINCTISYLVPFSVSRDLFIFDTDLPMRNAYIGIFTLIFLILGFTRKLLPSQKFLLAIVIFSFLFSLGDVTPIRKWSYQILPGMNFFRHPGNMRLFTSIGLIILAAISFQHLSDNFTGGMKKRLRLITVAMLVVFGVAVLISFKDGITITWPNNSDSDLRSTLKLLVDDLSFYTLLFWQGVIQLAFLLLFLPAIKNFNKKRILWLIILNALIFMQPSLFSTFVGKSSPSNINSFIAQHSKGDPVSNLPFTIGENTTMDKNTDPLICGYPSWFNSRIAEPVDLFSPCYLNQQMDFLADSVLRNEVLRYPPVILLDPKNEGQEKTFELKTKKFTTSQFSFVVGSGTGGLLGLFQNHYLHWKAYVDDREVPVLLWKKAFMSIGIPEGEHRVDFKYRPGNLIRFIWISVAIWILVLSYLAYYSFSKQNGKYGRV